MNDQDLIVVRAAVGLADYFDYDEDCDCFDLFVDGSIEYSSGTSKHEIPQFFLDVLAAQLTRQVDALPGNKFTDVLIMCIEDKQYQTTDRTMNTLRAIVDSEVLA